jgi:L-threonylcarbamoyladenylate synthase
MENQSMNSVSDAPKQPSILSTEEAAEQLKQGCVIAIPTETVYGLAADASQPQAVSRIFSIKGRPVGHPLIVHIGSAAQVTEWAREIPDMLWRLAEQFWPGPLTVILKKQPHVSNLITGKQDTVGLRIPGHPKALQLLAILKRGLAAPSANRFGRVSPTKPQHVITELGDSIDGIIDGGICTVGIESTILDLTTIQPIILRPGQISQPAIEDCLGINLSPINRQSNSRAPGMLKAHYAPATPLLVLEKSALPQQLGACLKHGLKVNLWSAARPDITDDNILWQPLPKDSQEFAKVLYQQLRQFDQTSAAITLIQRPADAPEWRAVIDRLSRASAHFSK